MAVPLTVNKAGYRKMFISLWHFGAKEREQRIERIHRLNQNLSMIVNGAPPQGTVEGKPRKGVAGQYQRVRNHAITLYGALKEKFQTSSCSCNVCTPPDTFNRFLH